MGSKKGSYAVGVIRGLQNVAIEAIKLHEAECQSAWKNSTIKSATNGTCQVMNESLEQWSRMNPSKVEKNVSEVFSRSSMIFEGLSAFAKYSAVHPLKEQVQSHLKNPDPQSKVTRMMSQNSHAQADNKPMTESEVVSHHESILKKEVASHLNSISGKLNVQSQTPVSTNSVITPPAARKSFESVESKTKNLPHLSDKAKERAVPASRIARIYSFGTLAAGLGIGTFAELTRRTLGLSENSDSRGSGVSAIITPANAERIVDTLCKVRGAALKIGQIFSIQDSNMVSPEFQKLFERVRQSADFMPTWQVENVMKAELGEDWKAKFKTFDMKPFAAASIGQVHSGTLPDGREVAIKIQYPGVAKGIESDIDNLMSVLKIWNIFPDGMFIDNLVEVAKRELSWEVDYVREAECTRQFKKLLEPYPEYYVPEVIDELCTARVFTTELIEGVPVDKCVDMSYEERSYISLIVQKLVLKEMFEFRFMQTDPNWSNFFYDQRRRRLVLLDFGATRSYDKYFMDQYLHVVKAALDGDRDMVLKHSETMGFLTGYESKVMQDAHVDAVMILGEILRKDGFDFGEQNTITRIHDLVPTIINHRLCPPPEEVYSLHRKLSGAFLLYTKFGTKLSCHDIFMDIYRNYKFSENR